MTPFVLNAARVYAPWYSFGTLRPGDTGVASIATLQLRNGVSYRVLFQYAGRRHNLHVGKVSAADAQLVLGQVELLLGRVKAGLLTVPPGADIVAFLAAGGKLSQASPSPAARPREPLTLGRLRYEYVAAHRGSLADNMLGEIVTHFKYLVETFGAGFRVESLELADLQRHVKCREAVTNSQGRPVSAVTVRRDVTTFRMAWRWAATSRGWAACGSSRPPTSCRT